MDIAGDDFPYGKIAVQMLFPTHGDVMTITAETAEPAVLKSAIFWVCRRATPRIRPARRKADEWPTVPV